MPSCNTGRNIQKYKGAAASTLQDVTDNGNTTTGDIITTSGFFIGDGSGLSSLNASNISSGTLSISRGGTNRTSYGTGDILYASSSSVLSNLAPSTSGYFLQTNGTGNAPTWENVADIGSATPANLYTDDFITGGPWSGITDANIRVLGNVSNLSNQLVARDDKGDIFVSNVNAIRIYGDGTFLTGVALSTDLASNSTRIGTISTDLASNAGRITTVETDLASNAGRITTVETDLASNSTRIGTVSTDLSSNAGRITTVETDLASNAGRITTVETDLASNSTRITNLQNSTIISNSLGITNAFEMGDLIYASGQNTLSNLSIGSTNEVLTVSGGIPVWATASGGGGGGYWTQNSSDIYYNTGNVGIGTTNPAYPLDVNGTVNATSFRGDGANLTNVTAGSITSEASRTIQISTIQVQGGSWDVR